MKAILIIGFRADVGAYIVYSYPSFDAEGSNLDVMNIYNLHRFRTTERNFQTILQGGYNIASYYSGFKNTNYIGAPDYCVTLLLDKEDNPSLYEKVLIKITNNLLSKLGSSEINTLMSEIFDSLEMKDFDEIKVERSNIDLDSKPVEHKAIATTSSATISEEEKIFAELMQSDDLGVADKEFDSKISDFEGTGTPDPFSGAGAADPFSADPFAKPTGTTSDPFAENPFDEAQKPSMSKAFLGDEALGMKMFEQKRTSAAEIVKKLDNLEAQKPNKPEGADKEANYKYLEELVAFLEEKVKMLGTLANSVRDLEKSHEEKDQLIGKLLLLLKGN